MSKNSESWAKIYDDLGIAKHDFSKAPFPINAEQIKRCTKDFSETSQKEVRVLCKQDSREDRPQVFIDNELFILPTKNGEYIICNGDGYVDIPPIAMPPQDYTSKLDFELKSSKIGDSEMQHLDFAYASSLIRTFLGDDSLVLSIRGRKYTPQFHFSTSAYQNISVVSVQTEVDSGFEGRDKIVLVEAKNAHTSNVIIRQLYYPMRQWSIHTDKQIITLFFEKRGNEFWLWEFGFSDILNYNSIFCKNSAKFRIV